MRPVEYLAPASSLVLVTLIAALPWGLTGELRYLLPFLPYGVIHFWQERRPQAMPEWLVFLAGLVTDALSYGPLGYWSLVFLAGYGLSGLLAGVRGRSRMLGVLAFAPTGAGVLAVAWTVGSLYHLQSLEVWPIGLGVLGAGGLYVACSLVIGDRQVVQERPNVRLERGA